MQNTKDRSIDMEFTVNESCPNIHEGKYAKYSHEIHLKKIIIKMSF